MNRTRPVFMQFNEVQFRAVAFVLAEAILRKTRAEVAHNRIARDFRDYARRRDAEAVEIAVDDRRLRKRKGKHRQAIDEHMVGDRKSTRLNSSHLGISYAVFCLK